VLRNDTACGRCWPRHQNVHSAGFPRKENISGYDRTVLLANKYKETKKKKKKFLGGRVYEARCSPLDPAILEGGKSERVLRRNA